MAASYGELFDLLARELGVLRYRVASSGLIPRELTLHAVQELGLEQDVDLNLPSHEILAEVFAVTGETRGVEALQGGDLPGAVNLLTHLVREFPRPREALMLTSQVAPAPTRAATKLEAVNRISELTGSGPQSLGRGSKERRSVLEDLHRGLGFGQAPQGLSKPELAELIVTRLGGRWDASCWSSGYTVTLTGLNRLLDLASTRLARTSALGSPAQEARLIIHHLAEVLSREPATWEGRVSVERMLGGGFPHARQTEWPAWYFEFLAIDSLMATFGGGPRSVGAVTFDYRAGHTWDLKAHAIGARDLPLNDQRAVDHVIGSDGGLGLIVLQGHAGEAGEHEFWRWHKAMRLGDLLTPGDLTRAPGSRRLKTTFRPTSIEAIWLDADAMTSGVVREFAQGKQADGSARKPKYRLEVGAMADLRVAYAPLGGVDEITDCPGGARPRSSRTFPGIV